MKQKKFISILHSALFLFIFLGIAHVATAKRNVWIRTGGPLGGLGYDVRMHPLHPDTMFVTDAFAGVYRSLDGGLTWSPSNNGINARGGESADAIPIFCLTIDQNNPDIIWAGLQVVRGIYKSTDMGENWTKMDNGVVENDGITFRGFTVDPRSSDIVYAAGEIHSWVWAGEVRIGKEFEKSKGVVYKTTDGGKNWNVVWRGDNLARYIWINPDHPDTLYVSTGIFDREAANSDHLTNTPGGVGILKSTDGGQTWQQKNNGITNLYIGTLFMHPENPDILLAGSSNNAYREGAGVFLTTNGGDSWVKVLGEGVQSVEFSVSNPLIAYAGNPERIYQSIDGGQTWQKVSLGESGYGPPGIEAGFPIDFQVDPRDPNRIFANNYGGGNFLSEDGGRTWSVASKGYTGARVLDIAVAGDNPMRVYAAARSGIFTSFDGGANWEGRIFSPAQGLEWSAVAVDPANPQHILAANNIFGTFFESYDGTETWRDTEVTLPFGIAWRTFAFAPSDTNVMYAGTAAFSTAGSFNPTLPALGIYLSSDGGVSWQAENDNSSQDANVADLAVDPANPEIVYAATINKGILKTSNKGSSWRIANAGLPENPAVVSVAIHPANPKIIFAGLQFSGLYKSDDSGVSWQKVAAGLPAEAFVTSIIFNPDDLQMLFAADLLSGVYRSNNGGQSWEKINTGLRTRTVHKLAISANGKFLYAATGGEGVFRLNDAGGTVKVDSEKQIPVSFKLEQNYPNPFNPATEIRYALRQSSHVQLRIFSLLGQEVIRLLDRQMPAGTYSATWNSIDKNGRQVASGIYLYELRAGEFVAVRKMIFMK